jgi:hypothetical protein
VAGGGDAGSPLSGAIAAPDGADSCREDSADCVPGGVVAALLSLPVIVSFGVSLTLGAGAGVARRAFSLARNCQSLLRNPCQVSDVRA